MYIKKGIYFASKIYKEKEKKSLVCRKVVNEKKKERKCRTIMAFFIYSNNFLRDCHFCYTTIAKSIYFSP